ncbi:unnamed protein product [Tilletia controversa]|uniref:Thc1 RRM domain-containing protein n=3 Tax=Tilletia TaxID=13289 RepID=A0A8X7MT36_9BASI|nr:hypothetical protein CF336_g3701 [Tilletia laevis]KAE8197938.1 hypothetical protein CF328_g3695 [Tilletia controversa]KAE8261425.1 hypothetical protein A4X03_0g3265 [Tilletia caries]KAE8203044.1 hypothetical protein CF335_g3182 [Tilletia laevis]KAE8247758.1 hypothetical protein A4X06_0g4218 [Tilletia controversa]
MSAALPLLSPLVTRILQLSGFPPELKTRDLQAVFGQWPDQFKIKWVDDTTALVIFNDPTIAKRAYLQTLMAPPPSLINSQGIVAKIRPYDGDDASSIISSLANRPRSRSNANGPLAAQSTNGASTSPLTSSAEAASSSPKFGSSPLGAVGGSVSGGGTGPSHSHSHSQSGSASFNPGHRRNQSGSAQALAAANLPAKPVAAALYDAANGGPSPARHLANAAQAEGTGLPINPLAAAVNAARVGQVAESAKSGKGPTLSEVNSGAASVPGVAS